MNFQIKLVLFFIFSTSLVLLVASGNPLLAAWLTGSDQVTIPSLVESLIRSPGNFFGWQLSRASFLFPDAFVYLVFRFISGNRFFALIFSALPTLLIWQFLIYRQLTRNVSDVFLRIIWTLAIGLIGPWTVATLFPQLMDVVFKYQFTFANHFTIYVYAVLFAYLSAEHLFRPQQNGWIVSFGYAFLFLCAMSNRLIWMFYFAPLVVSTLAINIIAKKSFQDWKQSTRFLSVNFIVLYLALRFEEFQYRQNEMPYSFTVDKIISRLKMFIDFLYRQFSDPAIFCFFLFCLISLLLTVVWICKNTKPFQKKYLFLLCLVVGVFINIAAAIFAWEGDGSARYLMALFFTPILFLANLVPADLWKKGSAKYITYFIGVIALGILGFQTNKVFATGTVFLKPQRGMIEALSTCIYEQGLRRGLANYWFARSLQYMSLEKIWVSHLKPDLVRDQNLFFYWGNDLFSFQQLNDEGQAFDFVIADQLDPHILENSFGSPERKIQCEGRQIWIYPPPNRIFKGLIGPSTEIFERELRVKKKTFIPACIFKTSIETSANCELNLAFDNEDQGHQILYDFSMEFDPGVYLVEIKIQTTDVSILNSLKLQFRAEQSITVEEIPTGETSQNSYKIKIETSLRLGLTLWGRKSSTIIEGIQLKRIPQK